MYEPGINASARSRTTGRYPVDARHRHYSFKLMLPRHGEREASQPDRSFFPFEAVSTGHPWQCGPMAAWIGSGTRHFDFTSFRLARDSQAVWVALRARFVGSGDRLAVGYIECVCAPPHLARASSRLTLPKQWVELLGGCRGVPFAIVSIFCRLLLSVAKFLANFCRLFLQNCTWHQNQSKLNAL